MFEGATDADDGPGPGPEPDPDPERDPDPDPEHEQGYDPEHGDDADGRVGHPGPTPAPRRPSDGPEGRGRWTAPVPDARPDWVALGAALRAVRPHELFAWRDAHRLPDGTRVDEFVRRGSCALLFLAEDGRAWSCRGVAPGAVGPSVLLDAAPPDELVRVLTASQCDLRASTCLGGGTDPGDG